MEFIKKNIAWIICAALLVGIIILTIKVINSKPVVIEDGKLEYLQQQHEQLQEDYETAVNEVKRWKELADQKPKEVIKIKIKYVTKIDSVTSLPLDARVQFLAGRLSANDSN